MVVSFHHDEDSQSHGYFCRCYHHDEENKNLSRGVTVIGRESYQ
jgi:hypothetical protein